MVTNFLSFIIILLFVTHQLLGQSDSSGHGPSSKKRDSTFYKKQIILCKVVRNLGIATSAFGVGLLAYGGYKLVGPYAGSYNLGNAIEGILFIVISIPTMLLGVPGIVIGQTFLQDHREKLKQLSLTYTPGYNSIGFSYKF